MSSRHVLAVLLTTMTLLLAGCGGRSSTRPPLSSPAWPTTAVAPTSPGLALSAPAYPHLSATVLPALTMPAPSGVDGRSADAVALAGVQALTQSDTAVDADPNDTTLRAIGWLTPAFAAQVRAFAPVGGPGAVWLSWAAHRAYVTVVTSLGGDDRPADTATTAVRQVVAVETPIGRDGWLGSPEIEVVFVSLGRVNGQWRIASARDSS